MLNIIENGVADISYTVQHIDDGKISGEYIIKCKATRIDKNGFSYYGVFGRDYRIIMDAFRYLNIYMKSKADQTRQQAMAALKYLYSYCTLFAIDPKAMNKDDSSAFISFLLGQSVDSSEVSFQFNIVRSSSSANDYLSSIRAYLKHPELKSILCLNAMAKKNISVMYREPAYTAKLRTMNRKNVPQYIKQDEFIRMVQKCREKNDLRLE